MAVERKKVEFLYFTQDEVEKNLPSQKEIIKIMEDVFIAHAQGNAILPPKFPLDLEHKYGGHLNIMPGYLGDIDIAGIKLITAYLDNLEKGLPSAMAMINLYKSTTGEPLAIMEGGLITLLRTGAVSVVAAKYLAPENAKVLGIIGGGAVAPYHIYSVAEVIDLDEVRVVDINKERANKVAERVSKELGIKVVAKDTCQEVSEGADIIITSTRMEKPKPLVKNEWVKDGALVMGTGQAFELDYEIPCRADKIIVDNLGQCKKIPMGWGFSVLFRDKVIDWPDIYAELGEVILDKNKRRKNNEEVIVLWPRGMGTEDVATAYYVYKNALEKKLGTTLSLF